LPLSFDVVSWIVAVDVSLTVTLAPETVAPLASVTVPSRVPLTACAFYIWQATSNATTPAQLRNAFLNIL